MPLSSQNPSCLGLDKQAFELQARGGVQPQLFLLDRRDSIQEVSWKLSGRESGCDRMQGQRRASPNLLDTVLCGGTGSP